jgi:hypothetical protein
VTNAALPPDFLPAGAAAERDPAAWLAGEIVQLELRLQGQGPMCRIDRQASGAAGLKADEGRYALLRRAARLLERAEPLAPALDAEAAKSQALLAGDSAVGRDPLWRAYHEAVLAAIAQLRERFDVPTR